MGLIDQVKSALVKGELIKQIQTLNVKGLASELHKHLDILLTDKDTYAVKIEIAKKLRELADGLIEVGKG